MTMAASEPLEVGDCVFWDEGELVRAGLVQDIQESPVPLVTVKTTDVVSVGKIVKLPPARLRHHAEKKQRDA